MRSWYDDTGTFYLQSDIALWKFFWKEDADGFLLYHRNSDQAARPFGQQQ